MLINFAMFYFVHALPQNSWDVASLHSVWCRYTACINTPNPLCLRGKIKYWFCAISFPDVIRPSLSDIHTQNCTVCVQQICSLYHFQLLYMLGTQTSTHIQYVHQFKHACFHILLHALYSKWLDTLSPFNLLQTPPAPLLLFEAKLIFARGY